ncbi:hypothetical protein DES53_104240 [Roseimicrobium gellanilyticum]|uniref:Lipoprotein n=1 Tax=Roseimicrobium gellanilyticum TaxID=748857 RepID=A0A366HPN1_9BACT|nr:hypothetical protein [Roseimicrobium gellanilyticum]RBP44420.1 hypothetical protein DES53_104240 [Roseimicrobium gellanilyticum]
MNTRCFMLITALLPAVLLVGCAIADAAPPARDDTKPMDAKTMCTAFCHAGSRVDTECPGGFGKSDNDPVKLDASKPGKPDELSLVALPSAAVSFHGMSRGFKLLLINRTHAEKTFAASDSTLNIIREAMDTDGKWKPIESLPRTFCGNSFHRVFLPAGHCWEFPVPEYTGTQKVRMRFALLRGQKMDPLYSNEFDGSVNPEQFIQKVERYPWDPAEPAKK